jgi:hypothetical protein
MSRKRKCYEGDCQETSRIPANTLVYHLHVASMHTPCMCQSFDWLHLAQHSPDALFQQLPAPLKFITCAKRVQEFKVTFPITIVQADLSFLWTQIDNDGDTKMDTSTLAHCLPNFQEWLSRHVGDDIGAVWDNSTQTMFMRSCLIRDGTMVLVDDDKKPRRVQMFITDMFQQ